MDWDRLLRLLDAAEYLAAHIHEAAVNMLLAARALGLGATFTNLNFKNYAKYFRT
jgi:nitroreductase